MSNFQLLIIISYEIHDYGIYEISYANLNCFKIKIPNNYYSVPRIYIIDKINYIKNIINLNADNYLHILQDLHRLHD